MQRWRGKAARAEEQRQRRASLLARQKERRVIRTRKPNAAASTLMGAEWMVDVPPDLSERWLLLPRPVGTRCLVSSGGGVTTALARKGARRAFPSSLPGGSRTRGKALSCELDCIWHEPSSTYFVLDAISWKGTQLVDCPAEFRFFWLSSKLLETQAHVRSSTNPCAIFPLEYLPCSVVSLRHAYASALPYERDGLLFVHRDGLYEPGASPLVLSWSDANILILANRFRCSARFYDYGSEKMEEALAKDPMKAERWRTSEIDAAISIEEIQHCIEQPPMSDVDSSVDGLIICPVERSAVDFNDKHTCTSAECPVVSVMPDNGMSID
ncbi:MAG: hypothetical protein SGPRY_000599 [Prymnesium sp.]